MCFIQLGLFSGWMKNFIFLLIFNLTFGFILNTFHADIFYFEGVCFGAHWCHRTCRVWTQWRPQSCLTGASAACVLCPWVCLLGVCVDDRADSQLLFFFYSFSDLTCLLSFFFVAFQEDSERYSRHSRRHASVCICHSLLFYFFLLSLYYFLFSLCYFLFSLCYFLLPCWSDIKKWLCATWFPCKGE